MRVSSISKFITIFTVLSTLLVPTLPASLGMSQVLAQSQDARKQEADNLQFFVGKSQPKIQIIKGAHFGTETSERVFKGATWIFYPDGKFIFNPSENANVRQDLYPIIGTYVKNKNNLVFRGEKQSDYNSTASVDGIIRISKEHITLEVIYTVSAFNSETIVKITQILAQSTPLNYQEPVAESVKNSFQFSGIWKTDIFGEIQLQQIGQKVKGTYTGQGGGTIEGTVEVNRLDFIWKDYQNRKGWGFFRAISGGLTLTGLWGKATDKNKNSSIIATIIEIPNNNFDSENPDNLKNIGIELALNNRCFLAINPLTKALIFYSQKRNKNQNLLDISSDSDLFSESSVLMYLSMCYYSLSNCNYQIREYDKLLEILTSMIEVRKILNQKTYLRNTYQVGADGFQNAIISYIRNCRIRLTKDLDKIEAQEKAQSFFDELIQLLVDLESYKEALVVAEKSRARAIADLLAGQIYQSSATSPDLEQIKQIAKAQNATLVEYSLIGDQDRESELYIWVIKPTGEITFRSVNLESLNTAFTKFISNSRESIGVQPRASIVSVPVNRVNKVKQKQKLQQLHNLLIEPIADILPNNPNDRVIFIPQGSLFLVPFPALQDAQGKYLIEKHTILTAPSIQVLDLTRQQKLKLGNKQPGVENSEVLIVGNPTMPEVILEPGKPAQRLNPLPGAKKEAQKIASMFKTQSLTGDAATETKIRQLMPKADIIHFATHGLFDGYRGLGSSLAFAPSREKPAFSQGEVGESDGLLTAEEILNLYAPPKGTPLRAQMVVLSACDTGRGRITGDGVIGLSRSLISAGVPSVVVSLWAVPDNSTAFLMTEFYQNLQQKHDKATALRKAMLSAKEKYTNPLQWAAFTLIGEAE